MQTFVLSALDITFRLSFVLVILFGCAVLSRDNKLLYRVFVTVSGLVLRAILILMIVLIIVGLIYLALGV